MYNILLSFSPSFLVYRYELLTAEWPWKEKPPESIIWMVGKGMKPSLANLQASREVKDILLMCWTFKPEHRPDFAHLSNTIDKLPKKKGLSRSLSQSNNPATSPDRRNLCFEGIKWT